MRGPRLSRRDAQFCANPRQNGIEITQTSAFREADHAHAEAFENFSPQSVMAGKPFVLLAGPPDRSPGVHRELRGMAVKIDDEVIEGNLPPNFAPQKR